jgi:hypothetical protein
MILLLQRIHEELPLNYSNKGLTNGAHVFVKQVMNPILNCLKFHCNDDIATFRNKEVSSAYTISESYVQRKC